MQENNKRKQPQQTQAKRAPAQGSRPAGTSESTVRRKAQARKAVRRQKKGRGRVTRIIAAVAAILVLLALLVMLLWEKAPREITRNYPMEYVDLIRSNAALQGIEPAQAAAVILAESGYDPNAVSSVNAQGLMQIMPETGAWLAGKFDEEYVEGCLFDPETNIRYGCWYLGYLMRRYDGDLTCATAAYHSGQGAVDKWLADPAFSADGRRLIEVKGENAKKYVSRVLEYYEEYQELYGPA